MRWFPILDELFSSDTIVFMIIGVIIAIICRIKMKDSGKLRVCLAVSFLIYVCCELLSNFHTNYMLELILLFAGTIAIGSVIGFLIASIVAKVKQLGAGNEKA